MTALVNDFPFEQYQNCLEHWAAHAVITVAPLDPNDLLGYLDRVRQVVEEHEGRAS